MFIRAPIGMPNVDLLGQQQERDKINPRDDDAGAGCGVSPLKQHRQTACRILPPERVASDGRVGECHRPARYPGVALSIGLADDGPMAPWVLHGKIIRYGYCG